MGIQKECSSMKRIGTSGLIFICAGLLLAAFVVTVLSGHQKKNGHDEEKDIIEGVIRDSFCWAFTKDRALLESRLSRDSRLFMFNPDSRSTVVGWDNFVKAFDIWMDPRFESTRFDMRDLRINISQSKEFAWYSAIIDDCAKWDGEEICWTDARWTGVLEKRNGEWLIVQMHISVASDQNTTKSAGKDHQSHSDLILPSRDMRGEMDIVVNVLKWCRIGAAKWAFSKSAKIASILTVILCSCQAAGVSHGGRTEIYGDPKMKEEMMAAYDRKLSLWPHPCSSSVVKTRFGTTHVIISGDPDGKPLVLLHAMGVTSTMWLPNICVLGEKYRLYAVDTIGDIGKSELDDKSVYPENGKEYSDWLADVIRGLDIENPNICGSSMGAWIASNFAACHPEMVDRLILLGPIGISSIRFGVMWRLLWVKIFPTTWNKKRLIEWTLGDSEKVRESLQEHMDLAVNCRPKVSAPKVMSDAQLRSIESPALIVLGGADNPIGDPVRLKLRAERLMTDVRVVIIPNACHMMNVEHPDLIDSLIVDFISYR
jgi:pimeloyl-ACP methyl ester carboxylesterase/ketosteroid isomerase-like protein